MDRTPARKTLTSYNATPRPYVATPQAAGRQQGPTGASHVRPADLKGMRGHFEGVLPDWQRGALPKIQGVLASVDWLALPTQWEIHEYRIKERFCCSVEDDEAQEQLLRSIEGRGAFRRFRRTAERLHLTEDWYAYGERAYEKIGARWLEVYDIPSVREPEGEEP